MRTLAVGFSSLLLLAPPLSADPIAAVRTALGTLTAREPIRASYELQHSIVTEGKFDNDRNAGKVTVELEGGPAGFHVVFPPALLQQIEREQQAKNRDNNLKAPTVIALSRIDPVLTAQALDFAPVLHRMLEGATLVSDSMSTWQGKPARALVVRVPSRLDDDDAKRVKIAENRLTLWLGTDLIPLAAEHVLNGRFSILVFKAEMKQKTSWHLTRVADRLVRVRYEEHQTTSGMGQKGNETVVATVRVH